LFFASGYAYLARGTNGLRLLIIQHLSLPVQASNIPLNSTSNGIFIYGNFAYVAADANLYEVDISSKSSPFVSRNSDSLWLQ